MADEKEVRAKVLKMVRPKKAKPPKRDRMQEMFREMEYWKQQRK